MHNNCCNPLVGEICAGKNVRSTGRARISRDTQEHCKDQSQLKLGIVVSVLSISSWAYLKQVKLVYFDIVEQEFTLSEPRKRGAQEGYLETNPRN